MTAKKHLRVADDSERLDLSSVLTAAEHGTALDEMKAVRAVLARAIDNPKTSARDLAALTRRHLEVSREVRALEMKALEEVEALDDAGDERFDASAL